MRICSVETREFDADILALMGRRLKRCGDVDVEVEGGRAHARAELDSEGFPVWCAAVEELLLYDLMHFELARMVEAMPIPLNDKREILSESVREVRKSGSKGIVTLIMEHYASADKLNLEGFMRFRMRDVVASWELTVMRAAEEQLIKNEYLELMSVLNAFVRLQPAKVREISVVLNPDGSCTVTDDSSARIDCDNCAGDSVISMLVSLAPERVTVYDLSFGKCSLLSEVLTRVFEGRIKFF